MFDRPIIAMRTKKREAEVEDFHGLDDRRAIRVDSKIDDYEDDEDEEEKRREDLDEMRGLPSRVGMVLCGEPMHNPEPSQRLRPKPVKQGIVGRQGRAKENPAAKPRP